MTRTSAAFLLWAPRILGILMTLFLGLFALDAFRPDRPLMRSLAEFAIHLLPALGVAIVVLLSWRREWIGGIAFLVLALAYAAMVRGRLDWILVISGPLVLLSAAFLLSWWSHAAVRTELR